MPQGVSLVVAAADAGPAKVFVELGAAVIGLAVLARFAHRLGFSAIPLYLLGGLAFGKGGLLPLRFSEEFVRIGAEIGIILLLFMLGLEYTGEGADGLVGGAACRRGHGGRAAGGWGAGGARGVLDHPRGAGRRRGPGAGAGAVVGGLRVVVGGGGADSGPGHGAVEVSSAGTAGGGGVIGRCGARRIRPGRRVRSRLKRPGRDGMRRAGRRWAQAMAGDPQRVRRRSSRFAVCQAGRTGARI